MDVVWGCLLLTQVEDVLQSCKHVDKEQINLMYTDGGFFYSQKHTVVSA